MSGVWKYRLSTDFVYRTNKPTGYEHDLHFEDESGEQWMTITPVGDVIMKAGYAWDGCSPKIKVRDWFFFGVPDGTPDPETGLPKTYYGSLIHDGGYQFLDHPLMPYSINDWNDFFKDLNDRANFSLSNFYYRMVRLFGGAFRFVNKKLRGWNYG